ncbi:hypothetical protein HYH03_013528 [Edaphochlamys debaryana]|uniref:Uncharacterized protein n=1 Tax=Edaphochlamys debaryana TaxID=47281 RepID=A0A835XQP3_9CHLO|nr:hypothetical protein HYH03_013528 [Edaphochlamys debaryana]|eukprot:KAG2487949.1 hypothetical protein HYH03_013528 [Edaphochlamys debaryana]
MSIGEEAFGAELLGKIAHKRRLMADINTLLAGCLSPEDGGELPAIRLANANQDNTARLLVLEFETSANTAGDTSLAVAARLSQTLHDETSCLRTKLKEGSSVVRLVYGMDVNHQLRAGLSEEDLAAARRAAAERAAGLGLPDLWEAQVQALAAEAGLTAAESPDQVLQLGGQQAGRTAAALARRSLVAEKGGDGNVRGMLPRALEALSHPHAGLVSVLVCVNAAAVLAVAAVWRLKRKARRQAASGNISPRS